MLPPFSEEKDGQVYVSKTMHERVVVGTPFGTLVTMDRETSARK
jgi:hypothetical protein